MNFRRGLILGGLSSLLVSSLLAAPLLVVPFALSVGPARAADKVKIGFLLKTMQEERYSAIKPRSSPRPRRWAPT